MRQKKELGMVLIFLGLFFGYALLEASQRGLQATFQNPVFLGARRGGSDADDGLAGLKALRSDRTPLDE